MDERLDNEPPTPRTHRRRWRPRRWLVYPLVVVALLLAGLHVTFRSEWLLRQVESRIENLVAARLGRDCELVLSAIRPLALRVEIASLRIAGESADGGPLLRLGPSVVDARWGPLLRRRLALSELSLGEPFVDLRQLPRTDETPGRSTAPPEFADLLYRVELPRTLVEDGAVLWSLDEPAIEIAARHVDLEVRRRGLRLSYALELGVGEVRLRANGEELTLAADAHAVFDRRGLAVEVVELRGDGVEALASAQWTRLAPAEVSGSFDLELQTGRVAPFFASDSSVEGILHVVGRADYDHPSVHLDLEADSSSAGWGGLRISELSARLSGGTEGWDADAGFEVAGTHVAARASSGPTGFPVSGEAVFSSRRPEGLGELAALTGGPPLSGALSGSLRIEASAAEIESVAASLDAAARDLRIKGGPADGLNVELQASVADGVLSVGRLRADARGAALAATGSTSLLPDRGVSDLTASLDTARVGDVLQWVDELATAAGLHLPVLPAALEHAQGGLHASARLGGPPLPALGLDTVQAGFGLALDDLSLAGPRGLPLSGEAVGTFRGGQATLQSIELEAPGLVLSAAGAMDTRRAGNATLSVGIDGLGEVARRLEAELSVAGVQAGVLARLEDVSGRLTLRSKVAGPWRAPSGTLSLNGTSLGRPGGQPRSLSGEIDLRDGLAQGEVRLAGEEAVLELRLVDVSWPPSGNLIASVHEPAPGWWLDLAGTPLPLEGTLHAEGSVDLAGRRGQARAGFLEGTFAGEPFEIADAQIEFSSDTIRVVNAAVSGLGGRLMADGELSAEEDRSWIDFDATGILLDGILRVTGAEDVPLEGELAARGRIRGRPASPDVVAETTLSGLALSGHPLPALTGQVAFGAEGLSVDLTGDGAARIVLDARRHDGLPWKFEAHYPVRFAFQDPASFPPIEIVAEAVLRARLSGNGADRGALSGTASLEDATLRIGERTMTTRRGPALEIENGRVRLPPFDIVGAEETRVTMQGSLDLGPGAEIDVDVGGAVRLEPLAPLVPGLRAGGVLSFDVVAEGPVARPDWQGRVRLREGRLAHTSLPAGFENLQASARLDSRHAILETLTGTMGGGPVEGRGWYELGGRFHVEVEGERVRFGLGRGLRSEVGARLKLDGGPEEPPRLSGKLDIVRAEYREDIRLGQQLLARSRAVETGPRIGRLADELQLDLRVESDDGVFVRNNLADFEIGLALDVSGSLAEPLASGQARVLDGGRVIFRGVTYQVERGRLDYVADPLGNPTIDIEAQTSVGRYDVRLLATGPATDPRIDLSSTPALPEADIVALLLTGRTREEFAESGGGLSEAQAALYLSSGLSREVESTLEKSLGLDEIRLDPALVQGEADPTARITLGKSLSGSVSAVYSRALSGNKRDIYQIRFEPRERLAFVGRNTEEGELIGEALYARKFYVGPERPGSSGRFDVEGRRISRVDFEGNVSVKNGRVRKALDLGAGDRYRLSRLLSGLDAIRGLYTRRGRPETRVEARLADHEDRVALTVSIEEGPLVTIRSDGWHLRKEARRQLLGLWRDNVFLDAIEDDASDLLRDRLTERGWVRAAVESRIEHGEDGTVTLHLRVDPGKRVRVRSIDIEGADSLPPRQIREQMLTEKSSLLAAGWLRPKVLDADAAAIRDLYLSRGFLDVRVAEPEVDFSDSPKRADVRIRIEEGPQYVYGDVRFSGVTAIEPDSLASIMGLSRGAGYEDQQVRDARRRLRSAYDSRGFTKARIETRLGVDPDTAAVDIEVQVDEGRSETVETVDVEGLAVTRPHIARREVEIEPGEPLSEEKVARSRQNLYRTGLFRSVEVVEEPGDTEDSRRVTFEVEEGPNMRTDYGLGYSTDEGPRGTATVSHANLFGRQVYGSAGARVSAVNWRVFALARQPRLAGTRLEGLASGFVERDDREAFVVRSIGATAQIDRVWRRDRKSGWFSGYELKKDAVFLEGVEITGPGSGSDGIFDQIDLREETIVRLGDLYYGFALSSRDDFLWPTRGQLVDFKLSWFDSILLSERDFVRAFGSWSWHKKLHRRLVWHGGLRAGLAEPYAATELVPISERFFAGGDDTVRGFARDSIFPVGFPGELLEQVGVTLSKSPGGAGLFITNQELMASLTGPFWLVLFYDAGNVYWTIDDFDPTDLRQSAGLGFRMRTPIGPLRLEYGWKLHPESQESAGRFHFSVGFPF